VKYSDVRVEQGEIVVVTDEVQWNPMAREGPDPSRDAASAAVPVAGNTTATLVVEVGSRGHILEHAAGQDGLVFVMSGSGELGLPGTDALSFRAPAVILVRADVPHSWDAGADGFTMGVCLLS
jgi:quercetin dioxygenase-like cupin family protein